MESYTTFAEFIKDRISDSLNRETQLGSSDTDKELMDREFEFFYTFMNQENKSLRTSIKSKHTFEFCKVNKHNNEWDVVFIKGEDLKDKKFSNFDYPKNLFLFIGYEVTSDNDIIDLLVALNMHDGEHKTRVVTVMS